MLQSSHRPGLASPGGESTHTPIRGQAWDEHHGSLRETRQARLRRGDLLLIDEAAMVDQDTALALLTIADEAGARVAFRGDLHRLPWRSRTADWLATSPVV